jgi:tRNA (guanine37-N1)-methyltransferase
LEWFQERLEAVADVMQIHILTLFPQMFSGPFQESILKRAVDAGIVRISLHNIRDYARDKHQVVDDYQYGGGSGMVMKPEPVFDAVEDVLSSCPEELRRDMPVILLSPQGRVFDQAVAKELSGKPGMLLICGRYEGVDERVREHLATDEISLGDIVLSGGEIAAMAVVEAVVRLLPGAVGSPESVEGDSITSGLLQHPLYTRPPSFRGWEVPPVLMSGDHGAIRRWRRQQSLLRTLERRPALLDNAALTDEELRFLRSAGYRRREE